MRLAALVAVLAALAVASGCGDSSGDRPASDPAAGDRLEREVRSAWERNPNCRRPAGASRWGCSVRSYRCQAVVTGRGWSVGCARPGRSVAFLVRRG